MSSAEKLVHAFITNGIDFCNSLLYGLPNYLISKLERVQKGMCIGKGLKV